MRKIYREISNREMDNFLSFNEVRAKWNVIRSRVLFQFDSCSPVITGWWRKSQQSWRFNPKGRERKKERDWREKTGTWRVEIQDLSRNPRSRTPFSEAAQKDKSEADFSRQTGQQKRRNEKKTKKKKKEDGETNRRAGVGGGGKGSGTSSEPW